MSQNKTFTVEKMEVLVNEEKPNQKWYTDITEFNPRGEKCYLSPVLNGFSD